MLTAAVAFAALAGPALVLPASAGACSCIARSVPRMLRDSDAAIVGRLIKVVRADSRGRAFPAGSAVFRYRVKSVHKRGPGIRRGRMLSVSSSLSSASCGLPTQRRRNYGLFLSRAEDGTWGGSICNVTDPRKLREQTANSAALAAARPGAAGDAGGRSPRPRCSPDGRGSPRAAA